MLLLLLWFIVLFIMSFLVLTSLLSVLKHAPMAYGGRGPLAPRPSSAVAARALAHATTGPGASTVPEGMPVCDPDSRLVFFPELEGARIEPSCVRCFQTVLKMHTDRVYDVAIEFEFSLPGCILGIFVDQVEYFNDAIESTSFRLEVVEIDVKPGDVVTVSCRNPSSADVAEILQANLNFQRK